jgi:hypothetical protein
MVSVVPAGLTRLFQHPTLDWNLFSTNQHALTDREVGTGCHAAADVCMCLPGMACPAAVAIQQLTCAWVDRAWPVLQLLPRSS